MTTREAKENCVFCRIVAGEERVAEAIRRSGLRCEGINLFLADGEAAFQEAFHFHLHVFPRYRGSLPTGRTSRPARSWIARPR